jgi:hypothetical protein
VVEVVVIYIQQEQDQQQQHDAVDETTLPLPLTLDWGVSGNVALVVEDIHRSNDSNSPSRIDNTDVVGVLGYHRRQEDTRMEATTTT